MFEFQMVITIIGIVCGILFGFVGYRSGIKKDGDEKGVIKTNVENIKGMLFRNIEETKRVGEDLNAAKERLTRVEESVKYVQKEIEEKRKSEG